jgi:hypothetical protein
MLFQQLKGSNQMDNPIEDMPTRARMLYKAAKLTTGDRDKAYGSPVSNMQDIASLWTAYLRMIGVQVPYLSLRGEDVAHMMALMKMSRTVANNYTPDTYIDSACYEAIAGECAEAERGLNANPVD